MNHFQVSPHHLSAILRRAGLLALFVSLQIPQPLSAASSKAPDRNSQQVTGSNNTTIGTINAGGDVNIKTGATKKEVAAAVKSSLSPIEKQLAELKQLITKQDLPDAKNNPAFLKIVRNLYKRSFDELGAEQKATFWDELSKYLDKFEAAAANANQVMQGTVDTDLKALFPQIEQARANFDYDEVNRLLGSFEEKHAEQTQDLARVFYLKAQNHELQLNYSDAERYYKKAAAIEDNDPLYLNAHALSLLTLGRYAEAEPLFRRSLSISETQLGKEHLDVARFLNNLALLLQVQGKYAEAEPLYRRSLGIYEAKLEKNDPEIATSLSNLAFLLTSQGKYAEAEPLYRRSIALSEAKLGKEHPDVGKFLNNLAELLRAQKRYAEAEPLYLRSLAIWEKAFGKEHPDVAKCLNNIALLLEAQERYAEAEPLYRRALAISEVKLGKDHPDVAKFLNNLAFLLARQGKYAEAEPLYRRSLEICEMRLGKDHPDVATSQNNLAGLLQAQEKYAEAEQLFRRSLAVMEEKLGKDHPTTVTVRENLAALLEKMK